MARLWRFDGSPAVLIGLFLVSPTSGYAGRAVWISSGGGAGRNGKPRIPRGGYLVRRGRGRVIVSGGKGGEGALGAVRAIGHREGCKSWQVDVLC